MDQDPNRSSREHLELLGRTVAALQATQMQLMEAKNRIMDEVAAELADMRVTSPSRDAAPPVTAPRTATLKRMRSTGAQNLHAPALSPGDDADCAEVQADTDDYSSSEGECAHLKQLHEEVGVESKQDGHVHPRVFRSLSSFTDQQFGTDEMVDLTGAGDEARSAPADPEAVAQLQRHLDALAGLMGTAEGAEEDTKDSPQPRGRMTSRLKSLVHAMQAVVEIQRSAAARKGAAPMLT